jgi:hypothetical protein
MAIVIRNSLAKAPPERSGAPGVVLMASAVVIAVFLAIFSSDLTQSFPYLYLLPWITGLGAVLASPSIYLYYRGRLTLVDPIVFASWSYFFPAFVIGGLMLSGGWSQPYFLTFIQDAEYNLPYTVVLIMLGFTGLAAGYFSPVGLKLGAAFGRYLPKRDFDTSAMLIPGLFLLILGTLNTVIALFWGLFGYQIRDAVESYSGILVVITLFWMQGTFMLWYYIFSRGRFVDLRSALLMVLLLGITIGRALFAGNRAALLQAFILVLCAFLLAGRKLNFRRTLIAGGILSFCLVAGMIYGTTFRDLKGTESSVSVDQYAENILDTFDEVGRFDLARSSELAFTGLAGRFDTLSSVAVVVSNYEQLQPYEESYGLDDNIQKDISTFFIPRVLWNEKPVASEPRKYSDLYFNYGDNSFAITPIGDLLRNYGPIGVPIGMFILGILLRFIYRSLIEGQPRTIWRATLYFTLVMTISYEGFYGLLIPYMFKVGITCIVGFLIAALIARSLGYRATTEPA